MSLSTSAARSAISLRLDKVLYKGVRAESDAEGDEAIRSKGLESNVLREAGKSVAAMMLEIKRTL